MKNINFMELSENEKNNPDVYCTKCYALFGLFRKPETKFESVLLKYGFYYLCTEHAIEKLNQYNRDIKGE